MKNKYIHSLILCLILPAACVTAATGDTIPVLNRITAAQMRKNNFFELIYNNPALKQYRYDYKLTGINFDSEYENETEPIFVQEGDGRQMYGVNVESFIPLAEASLWGDASYRNGTKYNLKLSETSDAELLYPYLSGDTIGGNLQSETYRFAGGYARKCRTISWGLSADFRASQEYRAIDPRPANIASDLQLSIGLAFHPGKNYAAGGAIHLQKYKQKNEIAFYNELGDVKVYHYTGMGMDYVRFRTKADRSNYNGNAAGASIQLMPLKAAGWTAAAGYNRFYFEKIISSLNELNMLELTEHSATLETGYRQTAGPHTRAIRISGLLRQRTGKENIFGDESSNNYPYIASIRQYRRRIYALETAALYEYLAPDGNIAWAVQPAAAWEAETEQYVYPARKTDYSLANLSIRLNATVTVNKYAFRTQAFFARYIPIDSKTDIPIFGNENENFSLPALYHNFACRSGHRTILSLEERIDYAFRNSYAFFLQLQLQYGNYTGNITTNLITASCGINF